MPKLLLLLPSPPSPRSHKTQIHTLMPARNMQSRRHRTTFRWHYYNCLHRQYNKTEQKITKITFDVSCSRHVTETLTFPTPLSEACAVARVESFLRKKMTDTEWARVKGDIPACYPKNTDGSIKRLTYRYEALDAANCLEIIEPHSSNGDDGHYVIWCGS